jgi:hypothetical protein
VVQFEGKKRNEPDGQACQDKETARILFFILPILFILFPFFF